MDSSIWQRVAAWCAGWFLLMCSGQAQYVNTMSGQRFGTMWSATADYVTTRMLQQNFINSLGAPGAASASTPAPTTPTYKYPLSRMDFKFQGKPTAQKRCAELAETPEGRKALSELCLQIFTELQRLPDFRANNLASGLAVVIGLSLQVARGTELPQKQSEQLLRGVNDLLADTPGIQTLPASGRQLLYETWVMTGGLIYAVAQAGAEAGDEPTSALAKALAETVLKSFGSGL